MLMCHRVKMSLPSLCCPLPPQPQHCQRTSEKPVHHVLLVQTVHSHWESQINKSIPDNGEVRGEVRRDSGLFESHFWPKPRWRRGLPTFPTTHLTLLILSPLENHFFFFGFWKRHSINKVTFFDLSQASSHSAVAFTWLKTGFVRTVDHFVTNSPSTNCSYGRE